MLRTRLLSGGRAALLAAGLAFASLTGSAAGGEVKKLTFTRNPLPARQTPLIIGISVHFGIGGEYNYVPETAAALIGELGFDSFRDDLAWPVFDGPGSTPEQPRPVRLFDLMKMTKAQPLLILGHSNPAVPGGVKPLDEAGRAAFADFAVRAAAATRPFNAMYEIWNEWNLASGFRPPWLVGPGTAADPRAAEHYSALARVTVPALRAAEPRATILAGVVGIDPGWEWTRAIVRDGALNGASGLSVHLYNHCEPNVAARTATDMANRLDTLQNLLRAQTGAEVPVYLSEFGWPTARRPCAISRQASADYIAQMLLWAAATPWLKGAWIYQLKDQGRSPDEMEENFGLYDYNYNPKPAACAVREAIRLIRTGGAFHLERPFPDFFVLQAATADGIRLIAWTSRAETKGVLAFRGGEPHRAAALCNLLPPSPPDAVMVGPEPVVIDIDAGRLTVEAAPLP